jgi:hypothetical protein
LKIKRGGDLRKTAYGEKNFLYIYHRGKLLKMRQIVAGELYYYLKRPEYLTIIPGADNYFEFKLFSAYSTRQDRSRERQE